MNSPLLNEWSERIKLATQQKTPLRLQGGGSKLFYGETTEGELFDLRAHTGIVAYAPSELVVTVNSGTPLAELEQVLAEKNQFLPFEPPHFGPNATVAGCIAAGLAGPRRAAAGGAKDFVLGAHLLDGSGQYLRFGGQVMKNVAGYDVSRLLCGSLGSLGVITQLSLKVLPLPEHELTVKLAIEQADALQRINTLSAEPLPISASVWLNDHLYVRLSGAPSPIEVAVQAIGGESLPPEQAQDFWQQIKEQTHTFFAEKPNHTLWRLSVPSTSVPILAEHEQLIEWGGALRWLHSQQEAEHIRAAVAKVGGTATAFRNGPEATPYFHPQAPINLKIQQRLKEKFDPAGIFNPGRFYAKEL